MSKSTIKAKRKRVDTIELTEALWKTFKRPPFQREVTVNAKLQGVAKEIAEDGVFPGILTLGILDGQTYRIDGQHRGEAFLISKRPNILVDVHYLECDSMDEMAAEFRRLNSSIVKMRPDDVLKSMETTTSALRKIREECPFVGYGHIRRHENSPILSMSHTLACWTASGHDYPSGSSSAQNNAEALTSESSKNLIRFLRLAHTAWGQDKQYSRLWSKLNLSLTMWMFRRIVLCEGAGNAFKFYLSSDAMYSKLMMSLSASSRYLDYLVGRIVTTDHVPPTFGRMKALMIARLREEGVTIGGHGKKGEGLPAPSWAV